MAPQLPASAPVKSADDIGVPTRPVALRQKTLAKSKRVPSKQPKPSMGSAPAKPKINRQRSRSQAALPRRSTRAAARPVVEDDYGPEFEEPEFLSSSTVSKKRRGRRKLSRSGGISSWGIALFVVVTAITALVYGGYVLIRSDAFARIAGQEFRSVQPIYATGQSKTTREIHTEFELPFPISGRIEKYVVVIRDATADKIQLSFAAVKIDEFSRTTARSPESSTLINADRVIVRSEGISRELPTNIAPPVVAEFVGLLGTPIIEILRDSGGMGRPISLVSDPQLRKRSFKVPNIAVFIDAPFATNVEWWDFNRVLIAEDGTEIGGSVRYEKIGTDNGEITVSLNGTLTGGTMLAANGLTVVDIRFIISGQCVYSTTMNDWKSGAVTLEFISSIAEDPSRKKTVLELNVSFSARPYEADAAELLQMDDFLPPTANAHSG